jgi:hypothetical protein
VDSISANTGEQLVGELVDLVFQEVTISDSFETQAVTDGAILPLEAWSFDVAIEDLSAPAEACGGHGQLHGDHCDCDSGYRRDPNDPLMCIPA